MQPAAPKLPFEASFAELEAHTDAYVSAVFSLLESEFLLLPKGKGFIEYAAFEQAYEKLKKATEGFAQLSPDMVLAAAMETPLILVVLRTMLGFTPPELAYVASQHGDVQITQGFARAIDRKIRMSPSTPLRVTGVTQLRIEQLVVAACRLLATPAPVQNADKIHRLDKADTREGIESVRALSQLGAPYAMLLYERFLGRPFAGHRESVSELVGGFGVRRADMRKLLIATRGKVFTLNTLNRLVECSGLRKFAATR
jgi:hypothetical protein